MRNSDLVAEIVLDGIGKHEVTVGKTLHEGGSTETVGTVIGEVTLADGEEALDRSLELVVYPDTAHSVVDGGEDHHRVVILLTVNLVGELAGVNVGDLLIHVEEVAVTLANHIETETVDCL